MVPKCAAAALLAVGLAVGFTVGPALPLAAAEPTRGQKPGIDELVAYFDTIVFGSEFDAIKAAPMVRKWQLPLRVVVREYGEIVSVTSSGREIRQLEPEPVSPAHFGYVQKHLNTLAALTGLKTQDAKKTRWSANFTSHFVPPLQLANPRLANVDDAILKRLAGQGGCYFVTWPDQTGKHLRKAVIVVNKARTPDKIDHCVLEEMAQSLGLPNDADAPWPSMFANTGTLPGLSWVDRILIRTLYDPRLPPGMPRAEALEAARRVIGEIYEK